MSLARTSRPRGRRRGSAIAATLALALAVTHCSSGGGTWHSQDARSPDSGAGHDLGTTADAAPGDGRRPDSGTPPDLTTAPDRTAADGPDRPDGPPPAPDGPPCKDPGVTLASGVTVRPTNLAPGGQVTVSYPASGNLGGVSNLWIHYGFNFWSHDLGGGAKAADLAMSPSSGGGFEATFTLPSGVRLLDFVFFAKNSSGTSWDNNNKQDWHRSVGVPLYGPYLTLRDNTLSPTDKSRDPSRSVTVNFRSDRKCLGRVHYGTSASALTASAADTAPATDHHLHLAGVLSPGTLYYYRVTCTDLSAACAVAERSPVYSFRTPPAAPTAIKVAVLADPQDNGLANDRWEDVAAALTKPPHADAHLVLVAGDLSGDDQPGRWWTFFDHGRELLAGRPMLAVVGNHDTPTYGSHGDTTTWERLFDLGSSSGKDTTWALDYGPATFLGLNSETAQSWVSTTDWQPGGAQHTWLKAALARIPAARTWRLAVWHIPPYNAGASHADQNQSTRGVTALLDGVIDWVISGHEHLYQRTRPVRYGGVSGGKVQGKAVTTYGRGAGQGVGYLIAPAAGHDPPADTLLSTGAPERALLAYPAAGDIQNDKVAKWVGFSILELKGTSLTLTTYELGKSTPRDQLGYAKP